MCPHDSAKLSEAPHWQARTRLELEPPEYNSDGSLYKALATLKEVEVLRS